MREKKRKESKAEMEKVGQRKETLCRVLDSPIVTVNDDEFISALQLPNKRWPEVEKLLWMKVRNIQMHEAANYHTHNNTADSH